MSGASSHEHTSNPFVGPLSDPRLLIGREQLSAEFKRIDVGLDAGSGPLGVGLVGCRGAGKSIMLRRTASAARQRKWFTVALRLTGNQPFEHHFLAALDSAYTDATGRPLKPAAQLRSWLKGGKVKGAPFGVGVEIDLEQPVARELHHLAEQAIEACARYGVPLVVIVDEADFLTQSQIEFLFAELMAPTIERGGQAIVHGAGMSDRMLIRGSDQSTFIQHLVRIELVRRLSFKESRELLVRTAALAGHDWETSQLDPIARASAGVPRILQTAGSRIFAHMCEFALAQPDPDFIDDVVAEITHSWR